MVSEEARANEPTPWPTLEEEAYYGLPGEIVHAIEPHTEADPVAVLINLLCAFGNAIGRGAYFKVGSPADGIAERANEVDQHRDWVRLGMGLYGMHYLSGQAVIGLFR